jgi:hypothetical protein
LAQIPKRVIRPEDASVKSDTPVAPVAPPAGLEEAELEDGSRLKFEIKSPEPQKQEKEVNSIFFFPFPPWLR